MASVKKFLSPFDIPREGFVRRFHWTPKKNVEGILKEGLNPRAKLDMDGKINRPPSVFTWDTEDARPWEYMTRGNGLDYVPLKIEIPNKKYGSMERYSYNPDYTHFDVPNGLRSVDQGGHADIFKEWIPPEYITEFTYPDDWRGRNMEAGWRPGNPSIAQNNKVKEAWELKRNKDKYGTYENFLDEISRQCKDMGFESAAECGAYFLNPTTKKKGLPYIFKSRFIHNSPPIVDSVDPEMLNQWRKKYWNK